MEHAFVSICSHSMGEFMLHSRLSYPHTKSLLKKKKNLGFLDYAASGAF